MFPPVCMFYLFPSPYQRWDPNQKQPPGETTPQSLMIKELIAKLIQKKPTQQRTTLAYKD